MADMTQVSIVHTEAGALITVPANLEYPVLIQVPGDAVKDILVWEDGGAYPAREAKEPK
jgi:hypothetical protein|tara:strand:- start:531 stop:707 length:177 start_codon:yes stop_codon:yes gene_type:complete